MLTSTASRFSCLRSTARSSCLVLAGALLVGCLGSGFAKDSHAVFHGCKSSEVDLEELPNEGHNKFRSKGCGHEEIYYCILGKCRSGRILSIRQHAAEHNCKLDQITTEEPSSMEFVTTGCGQGSRYRCREVPNEVLSCEAVKQ